VRLREVGRSGEGAHVERLTVARVDEVLRAEQVAATSRHPQARR
jgi:hypothetical protein